MATVVSFVGCALIVAGVWGSLASLWREGAR